MTAVHATAQSRNRPLLALLRLLGAGILLAALIAQYLNGAAHPAAPADYTVNFFSFFTVLANLLMAIVLLCGMASALAGRADGWALTLARLCTVSYMVTTGIVYNTLLRSIELPIGQIVPWSNEVLHLFGPVAVLIGWFLAPGRPRITAAGVVVVAAFPLLWAGYTLVRGALTGWYPYPFLDPALAGGPLAVTGYLLAIALAVLAVAGLLVAATRRRSSGTNTR